MIKEIAHFKLASVLVINKQVSMHKVHDYADSDKDANKALINLDEIDDVIDALKEAKQTILGVSSEGNKCMLVKMFKHLGSLYTGT